ncbi:DUF397 domain-containing protein [Actinomadura harenae]|uniref:DUF397 domain-containing protein n=1 Tax=Actinomadura harenae TaxID=2483351 RepID=A0A3M2LSF0_9ACTN|nr:DUF397 domain-containing protein [Actinomadura harenae]RMI39503.1 DUF397 domain-containing protein [Actinomadura harenae]
MKVVWRKSSHSGGGTGGGGGDCVEVAAVGASVGVRDSKAPQDGYLLVGRASLAGLVRRIRVDESVR